MKKRFKKMNLFVLGGLVALLAGCTSADHLATKSQTPGLTKIVYEVDIAAPKSEVWKMLADFDNLDWAEGVKDAHYLDGKRNGVGTARHCDLTDGGYIVERVTHWEDGSGFTYVIDEAKDPISTESYAIWQVRGDEAQSTVSFEVHYKLKYGVVGKAMNAKVAKKKFSNQIVEFMGELKTHIEEV
jgi:hypothetical protein